MKLPGKILLLSIIFYTAAYGVSVAQDIPALPSVPSLPSLPPLPSDAGALPPLPSSPNVSASDMKIEPLPVPPLPSLGEMPFSSPDKKTQTPTTATVSVIAEKPKAIVVAENKPKKHRKRKHKQLAAHMPGYRHEHLPAAIYSKSYDRHNHHLPVAYYEKDYDALVFDTAARDDLNGLRALLDTGRKVDMVDINGDTPLHIAVKNNAINTARLLLVRRADPNAVDNNGMSPLLIARTAGNRLMERALEEHGAYALQASN